MTDVRETEKKPWLQNQVHDPGMPRMEMCDNSITIIAPFGMKNITSNHFVFWGLHVSLFDCG